MRFSRWINITPLEWSKTGTWLAAAWLACLCAGGCATPPPGTPSATSIDYRLGRSDYWFAKPAVAHVDCHNYDALWNTAAQVVFRTGFALDRVEYRNGLLTSKPLVSAQFFEPWRSDVGDVHGIIQSSIATVRRIVHIDIERNADGSFTLSPKVLVERHSLVERRVTSVTEYLDVFAADRPLEETTTEEGQPLVSDYWYAIGRDYALERSLAKQVKSQLPVGKCD